MTDTKTLDTKTLDTKKLIKALAVKDASMDDAGSMKCWPSVTGVLDLYGDVIFPGAFQNCLAGFLKRGFVPMDHEWHWSALVGFPTLAEERGNKLYSEFTFHSDQQSQDARAKCAERMAAGLEVGLSIGFTMLPGQYIYFGSGKELLAYAKSKGYDLSLFDAKAITAYNSQCCAIVEIEELWEYSLTPAPANPQAMAVAVKSYLQSHSGGRSGGKPVALSANTVNAAPFRKPTGTQKSGNQKSMKTKTICGALGLPLADEDRAWSAKDADQRLRAFTGATEEPNADYAKAFVAVDGPADVFASYKLPIADVVDGKLTAIPKALLTAGSVLSGTSGGLDLPDVAVISAKTFLEGYYGAMGKSAPWAGQADGGEQRWKGQYLGEYIEYSMCMAAMQQAWYALYYEAGDALEGYGEYGDMSDAERCEALSGMFDEHKSLCLSMFKAILTGSGEETAAQATLSVRQSALSQLSSLGDGLTYTKHARVTVDAARALIERTKSRIEMRLKEGRALSEANRQTLKAHRDTLEECVKNIDAMLAETEPKADVEKTRALRLEFLHLQFGH